MRTTRAFQRIAHSAALIPFAVLLCISTTASAAGLLGSAQPFAVLGATQVTNTGATAVKGDLGVYPGTVTGLGAIALNGTEYENDAVAGLAQSDASSAFADLAALPTESNLTGQDLGEVGVLTPGVYTFGSAAQLTGTLVLNFA